MWLRFIIWFKTSRFAIFLYFSAIVLLVSGVIVLIESAENNMFRTFGDGLWWAIVTLSTTGYGDLIPVTRSGRIIAAMLILVGVVGTSVFSGYFASLLVERRTTYRRGLMQINLIKDHIVICGWRGTEMPGFVSRVLVQNENISARQCVVITSVDPSQFDECYSIPELKELRFVHGDIFSEETLKRGNVSKARKVIVIPEPEVSGAESDSRVIMTVLALRSISRDVYIIAELNDVQYADQLRRAACDEVIFSKEVQQNIVACASRTVGLSNIVLELLSREGEAHFSTERIADKYISGTFKAFRLQFSHDSRLVLGVLEHSGNPALMKMNAIREAQKTANTSQLIDNLTQVRTLRVHNPVFLPDDSYIIKPYSRVMYVERNT